MCGTLEKCARYLMEKVDVLEKALNCQLTQTVSDIENVKTVLGAANCIWHILLVSDRTRLKTLQFWKGITKRMQLQLEALDMHWYSYIYM